MSKLKREEEIKFIHDKGITILFFSLYMISTLVISIMVSSGNNSGYIFGVLFGTTIGMFFFIPKITTTDKIYLIVIAVFFTAYPIACNSYIFKALMILSYCLFSLKFTMFISRTYFIKKKETC